MPQASALAGSYSEYNRIESSIAQQPKPGPTPQPAPVIPYTAPQQLRFRHITVDNGLSGQRVMGLVQTQDGFMWFGTTNGLDRYDGYKIVAYRNDPADPNSLSNNFISDLAESRTGTLWVATTAGLDAFDRTTERFTRYLNNPSDPQSLSGNTINTVYEDRSGMLWVGTDTGLNRFDPATGHFTRYLNDPSSPQSLSNNRVLSILEDRSGMLWVGTDGGLNRLDRATGNFTRYLNDPANPKSLSNNSIWDIYEDHAGVLWLATNGGGLNRMNRANGTFDQFRNDPNNPHSLSNDQLDCIFEDPSGALWVGTFGGGLSVLDPARNRFNVYKNDPATPTSLISNVVNVIYASKSGLIWLATTGGGVDLYNPQQQSFTVYQHDPNDASSLASDTIAGVYEDRNGVIWVGTMNKGLDRLVPDVNSDDPGAAFVHYPPDPANPQRLANAYVRAFLQDHTGRFWVGTYGGGLYRLDPVTGIFTPYRHDLANPKSLSDDRITGIVEGSDGQIWIATLNGLNRFDPARGDFTHYLTDPSTLNSVSGNYIWSIAKDRSGNIWIGTRGAGLNRIEPTTGKITRYRHDPNNPASLSDDAVDAVLVDRAGVVWAGMFGGGVDRLNLADGTFTHYRQGQGLASDEVLSMTEDGRAGTPAGNIWIVTGHGLSRLAQDRKTFRNYDASEGLPSAQYTSASYTTPGGKLLIGTTQGLVMFDPATLHDATFVPPVAFTEFLIDNKPVPVGPKSPLPESINQISTIQLSYLDRIITFGFSALSYRASEQNRYRYKLDGFDTDWTEVDSTRRLATYTNLSPGQYTFRVTASNGDGVWNETGRAVTFVIAPPWWETTTFRVLAILLMMLALFGAYRWRVGSLERRQRALELAVGERTADLGRSNSALQTEIVERKGAEQALKEANTQLDQSLQEVSALNEISQALAQWSDLTSALQMASESIARMFGDTSVSIWLLDDSRMSLTRVVASTSDQTSTDSAVIMLADDPVAEQLIADSQTLVISQSVLNSSIAVSPHLPFDDGSGSCMLVPLQSRGEAIGVLCIRAAQVEHAFTPAAAELGQTVAGTLANAIENARLFTEAQAAAAENERRRLARDLHDSVSQALYAAEMVSGILAGVWERDPKKGRELLDNLQRFTRGAQAEMRMLLVELRPDAMISTLLNELLIPLIRATRARSQVSVEEHIDNAPDLPPDVTVSLYRIAQEALNNIDKHANAEHVRVTLHFTPPAPEDRHQETWSGKVELEITDDGVGFDPERTTQGRLGLGGMRERAASIGADLRITSSPGSGTQISVLWVDHSTVAPDKVAGANAQQ